MTKSKSAFKLIKKEDYFYKKAKKIHVRARSYYKLEAIDTKFNLIKNNQHILDLGCAPGAWIQYLDSKINDGEITGIDLLKVDKQSEYSSNVKIIQGDFNLVLIDPKDEFDLILSDMAPEFSGDSKVDRGRTHKLNLETIKLSKRLLKKKGSLVIKTFEGEDIKLVREQMKKLFFEVRDYKPQSSKKGSSEFYIVGLKKKY